jgi:hypothetical protein
MKVMSYVVALMLLIGAATSIPAYAQDRHYLVVTASNTATNSLLVYNSKNQLIETLPTGGNGGVAGNAGGIATSRDRLAVVNFGSKDVSIFARSDEGFRLAQVVSAASSPVSVAFGHDHLYILGTTTVESHELFEFGVSPGLDGKAGLVKADGSAAQVGVLDRQLIISEKSNAIETVKLGRDGAVEGVATLVQNIPTNVNAPFGLVTRDNEAYVTIAHANEISLVRSDAVVTVTGSGTQSAPCWLALDGPYLFSANSPSKSVSRYLVYGKQIIQAKAVSASFNGNPTDVAYKNGLLGVIDGTGAASHLSIFSVDGDGELNLKGVSTINSAANGVAVVDSEE